jgi:hypothetical protein
MAAGQKGRGGARRDGTGDGERGGGRGVRPTGRLPWSGSPGKEEAAAEEGEARRRRGERERDLLALLSFTCEGGGGGGGGEAAAAEYCMA